GVFIWSDGFCDTVTNIIYITNIQLEKNEVASEYDWRSMAHELALCQRYYCKSYDQNIIPGTATATGIAAIDISGLANTDHIIRINPKFPQTMRSSSTVTVYDLAGTPGKVTMIAGNNIIGTVSLQADSGFRVEGTNGFVSTSRVLQLQYIAVAEL
ncbi:MAG: hypothetical protein KKD77_22045, partial [Gammaproteobacteria bacterium]|nr:hypothetical protein [Gammaproteobacteria bacterium]